MKFITHQGDISIFEVSEDEIKHLSFKEVKEQIVAEGEVTGHYHKAITKKRGKLEVALDRAGYYLRVLDEYAEFIHPSHNAQILPKGKVFYFGRQEEYDPIENRKKVED